MSFQPQLHPVTQRNFYLDAVYPNRANSFGTHWDARTTMHEGSKSLSRSNFSDVSPIPAVFGPSVCNLHEGMSRKQAICTKKMTAMDVGYLHQPSEQFYVPPFSTALGYFGRDI